MQEYLAPNEVTVAADDNVVTALLANVETHAERPALAYYDGDRFVDVSTTEFVDRVRAYAAGLIGLGVQPGDRVCVFMKTRIEFTLLDYAIWFAGATTVTIYETSSAEQVEWIVGNSEAVAIFCGNAELKRRFDHVADQLPQCRHAFALDDDGLAQLEAAGADVEASQVDERVAAITHADPATLVYTSGTTGRPKGCVISHGNLIWEIRQVVTTMGPLFVPGSSTLMFLPLAHILARVVQVGCVTKGVKIGYSTGLANMVAELAVFQPSWVFAVPRVFEKVFNTAQTKAGTGLLGKLFDRAVDVSVQYSEQLTAGRLGLFTRLEHALYNRLVFRSIRKALGGNMQFAISGGAPLGERLGHFFHGAGVLILEGYGLTETTAAATVNRPDDFKMGTVGKPVPGAAVRIADDGEILLRGGMVFSGYWRNEAATREVMLDDDWFATGDIGELDDDGFLRITGRKKELIVTAAGKNVAPAVLEDAVRAHPLVSQVMVIGDQQPFIAALVTLDIGELSKWAEERGASSGSEPDALARELLDDDRETLRREIQTAVDEANARVSRAESIREFRILAEDFTVASGELTPTLKMRRSVISERHQDPIGEIYGG